MKAKSLNVAARGAFLRLGAVGAAPLARFRKQVVRVGAWVHPDTGEVVRFTREDLERLASNTNRWLALGHRVWFSSDEPAHNADATKNLGWWSSFRVVGDELLAEVDLPRAEVAAQIGSTIREVSAGIKFDERSSTGEAFDAVIEHVAATPAPVLPGQTNFVRLAGEVTLGQPRHPRLER